MKKFLKDTRGVVMMEYIILGCFAVAITAVAVLALGKVYNNGLATMAYATAGETKAAAFTVAASKTTVGEDILAANEDYAYEFEDTGVTYTQFDYSVYGANANN